MILSAALLVTASLFTAPAHYVVQATNDVWDIATEDLNGDGRKDLLLLTCDHDTDPPAKFLEVVLSTGDGYESTPSIRLPLPPETGALFLAEVDGSAPREVVAAHASGARIYSFFGEGFREIAHKEFTCLLPSYAKEPLFLRDAAIDLTGSGIDEWLLPVPDGYELRNAKGRITVIRCNVVSELRRSDSTHIYHRLPAYQTFQLDNEQNKGIAFLSDEYADFAYGENWEKRRRFKIPVNLEEKWEASAKMADINNNGFPDLLVTQTRGTVNLESLSQIYVATEPFEYPETPTATFSVKGAISSPVLVDVNGNGYKDAVVISVPFGVRNLVNFFVRKRVTVDAEVYLYTDEGFSTRSSYKNSLILEAPEGREQIAYAMDDFDGDGQVDLAFSRGREELVVYRGEAGRFLASRPWHTFAMPSFGLARAIALDDSPGKDLVLFHPGGEDQKRVSVILF